MQNERFQVLKERFHFSDFREGQEEIIQALLDRRDVVAVMPTGSGKSLCYQLPALLLEGVTLVISPLIALMKDQVDGLVESQIPATFINSTLNLSEQRLRLQQMRQGNVRLVYVAPERFRSSEFMQAIQCCPVALIAVDEAHCVSEWGHDFRPDYLRIRPAIEKLKRPPIAALTATATPEVRRDIIEQLGLKNPLTLVTGFDRPNLRFLVTEVENDTEKINAILALLAEMQQSELPHDDGKLPAEGQDTERLEGAEQSEPRPLGSGPSDESPRLRRAGSDSSPSQSRRGGIDNLISGIIYAATRKNVETVTRALQTYGYKVGSYHAGMEMEARKSVQEKFMQGALPVVVATNAFGMGIDKADLRFIAHYDVPGSLEAYYQEVGRAGRDGKPASCLLLFNYGDTFTQEFFIEANCPPRKLVEEVYETICALGRDEVELTLKALAEEVGPVETSGGISGKNFGQSSKPSEMAVSSCLKILEKAGVIERGMEGGHQARVTIRGEPDWVTASARASSASDVQKQIFAYCVDVLGARPGKTIAVDLQRAAGDLGTTADQVKRALSTLRSSGCIEYRAPFRGRGLKILQRVPMPQLDINFGEIERRAQFERQKLRKMVDYAYARHCLRRFILGYFGERVMFHECHNCSHCLEHGKTLQARILTEEETVIVKKVLSCVARMKGRYGRMRVAQVLTGANIDALAYLRLNRLSTFGILKELSQPEVLSVIDALVESNLLQIEGSEYPLIQLTAIGVDAMLGRIPISMDFPVRLKKRERGETARRKTSRSQSPSSAASVGHHSGEAIADDSALPYHEELFEALRRMRRRIASSAGLAPFIIFHDETLKSISRRLPQTVEELRAVKGVGEHKIASYGAQTLDVVKDFLKNHPMVLPINSSSSQGRNR